MAFKWVPVVDLDACTGCGACAEACGPRCLTMRAGKPLLSLPDACGSEEHCIAPCPVACIKMAWVEMEGDRSLGRWSERH